MNKILLIAALALVATACKKNETEVKTEDTVIEGKADTVMVDTDTVAATNTRGAEATEAPEAAEEAELPEQREQREQPERDAKKTATAADGKATSPKEKVTTLKTTPMAKADYASFGDKILADNALTKEQMLKKYENLKQGDTLNVKFKTKVTDVCKKKGCWMALELQGEESTFVRFKDYGFFVPLNATGEEAVVSGKAFVTETSVEELKHYAKDGGKSADEIAKITAPKVEYGFLADGVLISR